MAARDLGNKFTCYKCSAKFYDLKKPAPICPKCGADQREQPVVKPNERRRAARAAEPVEPVAAAVDETDEEEEDEDEDEDDA
jgi:uncharacterized protein (TIGR02300 family)